MATGVLHGVYSFRFIVFNGYEDLLDTADMLQDFYSAHDIFRMFTH